MKTTKKDAWLVARTTETKLDWLKRVAQSRGMNLSEFITKAVEEKARRFNVPELEEPERAAS